MRQRGLAAGLLLGATAAVAVAAPGHAATYRLGPDLARTPPATVAASDPNDIIWWAGKPGVSVPRQGEIRGIRIKGGTQQTARQTANARAFDPNYDITHWVVLRRKGLTWRAVSSSEDVRLPVVGRDGVTSRTITTIRQPQDVYRVCARKGDRVALASVGGYVPTVDGTGAPMAGFQRGLPYQVFSRVRRASTNTFLAGGLIGLDSTVIRGAGTNGLQLQMQAVLGTGRDARYTCQTEREQQGG